MISISQYLLAVSAGRAMLSHELDASQFVRHARRASFKDPRPERASRVDLPVPSRYLSPALRPHKSFSCNRVEKSLHLCLAGLRIRWFDPIAEASELPKHLRSAELLRSFGDRWAPFFVTDSLVEDQPDQPTLSMSDGPNGLIVSQARDRAAIHDLEDASFGPGCGVTSLIE